MINWNTYDVPRTDQVGILLPLLKILKSHVSRRTRAKGGTLLWPMSKSDRHGPRTLSYICHLPDPLLFSFYTTLKAVLRIRDILERTQIRGSIPMYLWLKDLDPAIFSVFLHYFLKLHLHNFSKKDVIKKSQNTKLFGWWYGSEPCPNGSESGRPKNILSHHCVKV